MGGQCAKPERASPPQSTPLNSTTSTIDSPPTEPSHKLDRGPTTAPPTTTSFQPLVPSTHGTRRFGSSMACPGCKKTVSPMERGVKPGPQGTRWHEACLVCGGRGSNNKKDRKPGCGKKLDSAAKGDGDGGVWCRECMASGVRRRLWEQC
jgi:hypothetical protein